MGSLVFNGYRGEGAEKILETDDGGDYNVNVINITKLYTYKWLLIW